MLVRSLSVSGFRNLVPSTLEPGERFNVFSGDNGQGKTNLLEALYAVCTLRSFRSSRLRDLISIHEPSAQVRAQVLRAGLERKYELTISERSRVVRLDSKTVRPLARYFGEFNVVLFAPEDLLVARASPGERRRFLDRAVFNMHPGFLSAAQDYEKVLKNRNICLRDEGMKRSSRDALLDVYDQQLASLAAQVLRARRDYLRSIEPYFVRAFDLIARCQMPVELRYQSSGNLGLDLDVSESRWSGRLSGPLSEPSSESRLSEPSSEPRLSEPSSEPRLSEPSSESRLSEPSSESRLSGPLSEPSSEPSSEPRLSESRSEPPSERRSSESRLSEPPSESLSELQEALLQALTASRRADLARGATLVGPHRDLLEFRLAEQPVASFASQGQLRAMILAWKSAEMQLLAETHDDPPVLLLDDVSSELDPERNQYLFEFLKGRPGQCFITTTHPSFVLLASDRRDFRVKGGVIEASSTP